MGIGHNGNLAEIAKLTWRAQLAQKLKLARAHRLGGPEVEAWVLYKIDGEKRCAIRLYFGPEYMVRQKCEMYAPAGYTRADKGDWPEFLHEQLQIPIQDLF